MTLRSSIRRGRRLLLAAPLLSAACRHASGNVEPCPDHELTAAAPRMPAEWHEDSTAGGADVRLALPPRAVGRGLDEWEWTPGPALVTSVSVRISPDRLRPSLVQLSDTGHLRPSGLHTCVARVAGRPAIIERAVLGDSTDAFRAVTAHRALSAAIQLDNGRWLVLFGLSNFEDRRLAELLHVVHSVELSSRAAGAPAT